MSLPQSIYSLTIMLNLSVDNTTVVLKLCHEPFVITKPASCVSQPSPEQCCHCTLFDVSFKEVEMMNLVREKFVQHYS